MKLEIKVQLGDNWSEYRCDLTRRLDELLGLDKDPDSVIKHYILANRSSFISYIFPIRLPGNTVGLIKTDRSYKIKAISLNFDVSSRNYTIEMLETINKEFAGQHFEFPVANPRRPWLTN